MLLLGMQNKPIYMAKSVTFWYHNCGGNVASLPHISRYRGADCGLVIELECKQEGFVHPASQIVVDKSALCLSEILCCIALEKALVIFY